MAGITENYNLVFFDFGEDLSSALSVRKELERFVLLDRQLYSYFSVFGNGVISGWTVVDAGELNITINPGVGIINSFAVESAFSQLIEDLPANSSMFIYARISGDTVVDKVPEFIYSLSPIYGDEVLLLSSVQTSGSAISSIDNSVSTKIGFSQTIDDAIAAHRHDGVKSPRVDLTQEVQGQLPMSRMEDIDASKVVNGKLPSKVMPTLDHNDLKNKGQITHAGLDSFVKSLQQDNIALMGEIASINLMKMTLALKYKDSTIDNFYENMLCVIPGISPDEFIDWEASNAVINTDNNCVSGLPSVSVNEIDANLSQDSTGADVDTLQLITVPWETDQDFRLASSITNLTIKNGFKISTDTTASRIVESFDNGLAGDKDSSFTNTLDETSVIAVSYDTNAASGPLAGRFEVSHSRKGVFVREFSRSQDWSSYDTLNIYVQASNASHAAVAIKLKDSTGVEISTYQLLAADEVTTFDTNAVNGFVKKEFSLGGIIRNDVASIEFLTDYITNSDEYFLVDTISLSSQEFLLPQGNIKLRYNTTATVLFNTVDYDGDIPAGTDVRVRVKASNTLDGLITAPYTSLLLSGEAFGIAGRYIEIDITLLSDETLTLTPQIDLVSLSILVPAQEAGISITSADKWANGITSNISISDDGIVSMKYTNVGDIYFANGTIVNELDTDLLPIAGVTSENMPIAPYQGYAALNPSAQIADVNNPGREFLRGLYRPKSVYRLKTGNFLVCDTGNDRIIEFTQDGEFVRGYASHNDVYSNNLYALTANYNPRLGVLFITFSRELDIKFADLSAIIVMVDSKELRLSNTADKVRNVATGEVIDRPELTSFLDGTGGDFTGLADNVLSILISDDKKDIIEAGSNVRVRVTGNPSPATDVTITPGDLGGIECFVGDYMYFGQGGIWRPICAKESADDRFVYCNAVLNYNSDKLAPNGVVSTIEFDKAIGSKVSGVSLGSRFVNSDVLFSDIMLGSVFYFTNTTDDGEIERKVLLAGLQKNPTSVSSSSTSSSVGSSDIQKLSNFVGVAKIINMSSNLIEWSYTSSDGSYPSDAYVNADGNIVICESSIYAQSGRIVTVDITGTIIDLIEGGLFTKIWDIRSQPNGNIIVST